jgi:hypothetical protein
MPSSRPLGRKDNKGDRDGYDLRRKSAPSPRRKPRGRRSSGPAQGPGGTPVLLLHGWPYDIHTYVDVAPLLAASGSRVIVPYLRGYGATRFLANETPRNGQQSALAVDALLEQGITLAQLEPSANAPCTRTTLRTPSSAACVEVAASNAASAAIGSSLRRICGAFG